MCIDHPILSRFVPPILLVSKIEIEDEGQAVQVDRSDQSSGDKGTECDLGGGISESIYRLAHSF